MKIKIFSIIFLFLLSTELLAQSGTGSLKGNIVSFQDEPISGASIQFQNTDIRTKTDLDGNFILKAIPAGTYILIVSNVGYTASKQNLMINPGKTAILHLQLSKSKQELKEVVINRIKNPYQVQNSSSSTRMDVPLLSTPQSVQIISSQAIKDRQAFTLNEIAGTFTGMKANNGNGSFNMRGFTAYSPTDASFLLYNGIRGNLFLWSQQPLLYNVESVELLRGPSGALFSEGAPGGVVNFITKKPLAQNRYGIELSLGSWNFRRASLDLTGPLSGNKKLLYRAIIGYDKSKSFRDGQNKENIFIAPSLTYLFSDKTELNLEINYAYQKTVQQYDNGTFIRTRPDGTFDFNYYPDHLTIQSPTDYGKTHNTSATLTFNHRFNDRLKMTAVQRVVNNALDYTDHIPVGKIKNDSISRGYQDWETNRFSLQTTAYLTYETKTGPLKHQLTGGADYNRYGWTKNDYQYKAASRISIFNPDYSNDPPAASVAAEESDDNKRITNLAGIYLQDQISFGRQLKALLSLRYDSYDAKETPLSSRDNKQGDELQASGLIPRLGFVYLPAENMSIYGTYLKSFNPQTSNNVLSGGPFPTRKATQYEIGYKGDFFNRQLSTNVSLYQINYANILAPAPTEENSHRQAAIDGTRSRGVEFTAMGTIRNFNVIMGYAYNEHIILSTSAFGKKGDRFNNAPKHMANLWLKYNVNTGLIKGLGIAGGLRYVSDQVGLISNQNFLFPEYTVLDAAVNYRKGPYNLQFNAYNLTNKHYFTGSRSSTVTGGLGDPFNYRIGLSYQIK
ncbi:iron complex outermembrane recepter protein [Pedobacter steynii]|uniref:Iron complex outermembrane recepter protein n=1 Tax=Pedobacter steynii TaxID=430522 RepID=A0A1G9YN31_9SPHI|nr:TonB-dependent receptor [Pedobacter steynii]NQX39776.1 TonB-dependent receptor [Pedobacter steynii]SDN10427.1 iron complex outermembrane recepter protein [Pedobacter steynii]